MSKSWWLFYGLRIGMSRQEVMVTSFGEMNDLISCLAIYEGGAEPAMPKLSYEQVMNMR